MSTVTVRHEPADNRYVAVRDDQQVGLIDYRRDGEVVEVLHTETDPALTGQGIAAELTAGMLDDLRRQGLTVRPICPYTVKYLHTHAEYADLQV